MRVSVGTDVSVNGILQYRCSKSCESYEECYTNLKDLLKVVFKRKVVNIPHQRNQNSYVILDSCGNSENAQSISIIDLSLDCRMLEVNTHGAASRTKSHASATSVGIAYVPSIVHNVGIMFGVKRHINIHRIPHGPE